MPLKVGEVALRGAQLCLGIAQLTMLGPDAVDDPRPNQRGRRQTGSIGHLLWLGWIE
jgi:hypothetical protein